MKTTFQATSRLAFRFFACLAVILFASAGGGCMWMLPHKPCLLYYGDVHNLEGMGDLGRGGYLERTDGADYVIEPSASIKLLRDGRWRIIVVDNEDSDMRLVLFVSGVDLTKTADYRTDTGGLEAWLLRSVELSAQDYQRASVELADPNDTRQIDDARHKYVSAQDFVPLTREQKLAYPGAFSLTGGIRLRIKENALNQLRFDLRSTDNVPPNEAWLAACEANTAYTLQKYGDNPSFLDDKRAWALLRTKQKGAIPGPAIIGGEFIMTQCLDYGRMP